MRVVKEVSLALLLQIFHLVQKEQRLMEKPKAKIIIRQAALV
jgi:hypothetical protein